MADPQASLERTVRSTDAGQRLDLWLASQAEIGSRSRAKGLIRRGLVSLDGRPGKPGQDVVPGQVVLVRLDLDTQPDTTGQDPACWPQALPVLYEDDWLLVVDKPVGLAAHPTDHSPPFAQPNVAELAAHRFGALAPAAGPRRPGIVHRLDRETTGVMVLVRSDAALHAVRAQFKARSVRKEYRAVTFGVPRFASDWIERPLQPHPRHGEKMVVARPGEGKEASTFYEVVESFDDFAHLRCAPRTGRTHQIRVHLTSIGHSLVGDRLYVSRNAQQRELPPGAPAPGRHCLHAAALTLRHPHTDEELTFRAALPADIAALLDWLRAERPPR